MLGRKTQNILSHESKNSILYQWTVLVNYIVVLVWIGTIEKCHLIYARIYVGRRA